MKVKSRSFAIIHFHSPATANQAACKFAPFNRLTTKLILIVRMTTNKRIETILLAMPFTNSPIIAAFDVKAISGITANGNCSVIITLRMSFIPVKSPISLKYAMQNVGTMAIVRVNKTRFQRGHSKFKNPSITNWPAYVPVIVELWPDAKMPTAQMYSAYVPIEQPKKMPTLYRLALTRSSLSPNVTLASMYR